MPVSFKLLKQVAILVIPTIVLGGLVTNGLIGLSLAPTFRLSVTGYDPVHPLYGRYIRFRFDEAAKGPRPQTAFPVFGEKDDQCACLRRTDVLPNGQNAKIDYVPCAQAKTLSCEAWTKNRGFFDSTHEYFVDERYAPELDKILREQARLQREARRSTHVGNTPNPALTAEPKDKQNITIPPSRVTMDIAVSSLEAIQLKMLNVDNMPWTDFVSSLKKSP